MFVAAANSHFLQYWALNTDPYTSKQASYHRPTSHALDINLNTRFGKVIMLELLKSSEVMKYKILSYWIKTFFPNMSLAVSQSSKSLTITQNT